MVRRNDWSISALRMLAMCSIVACHFCQLYGLAAAWSLNIGVQVFLVISGWLYGLRPNFDHFGRWYGKRLIRICVPYWLVLLPLLFADLLFASQALTAKTVFLSVCCIRSGVTPNGAHLWYISVILLCYLITPLLDLLWRRSLALPSIGVALLFLFFGNRLVPGSIWCIDYLIAYALGRFVRDGVSEQRVLTGCIFTCGGGCLILLTGHMIFNVSLYTGLHLLGGPLIFSGLRLILHCERFVPSECLKSVLRWNDGCSYEVYLVHQILILGDFSLALVFPAIPILVIVLALIWSIAAGYCVHVLSSFVRTKIETSILSFEHR